MFLFIQETQRGTTTTTTSSITWISHTQTWGATHIKIKNTTKTTFTLHD